MYAFKRNLRVTYLIIFCLFFLACLKSPLGYAQEVIPPYQAALNKGAYDETLSLAKADGSSDALAFGARALLTKAQFFTPDRLDRLALIREALALAKNATDQTPGHLNGLLQQSVAIGLRGRLLTAGTDARASMGLLQQVLKQDPTNEWGLAGVGAWHGEVVLHAGTFFANLFYHAKRKHMVRFFMASLKQNPNNIAVRAGFIQTLLRFDREKYRKLALEQLSLLQEQSPSNHLEKFLYQQSMALHTFVEAKDTKAIKAYLKKIR